MTRLRPVQSVVAPVRSEQVATIIGEALVFLRREANHAGLSELAESISQSINTAAKLAVNE